MLIEKNRAPLVVGLAVALASPVIGPEPVKNGAFHAPSLSETRWLTLGTTIIIVSGQLPKAWIEQGFFKKTPTKKG
jgi:hypothetical protein